LTEDLVDQTIAYIRDQQQANSEGPSSPIWRPGESRALHAPKEYIEKYKGKFDQGGQGPGGKL